MKTNAVRHGWSRGLLVLLCCGVIAREAPCVRAQAAMDRPSGGAYANIDEALEALAKNRYSRVVRNERNEPIEICIPYPLGTDQMLMALSQIPSLGKLELGFGAYTPNGFGQLRKCQGLTNLVLKCFAELPVDVMKSTSELPHLSVLVLYVQCLKSNEVTLLAGMPLETLTIYAATNFGRAELERLSQMQKLKHIVIWGTGLI